MFNRVVFKLFVTLHSMIKSKIAGEKKNFRQFFFFKYEYIKKYVNEVVFIVP